MKQDGKTLVELIVVAGILATVSIIGIPNFLGLHSTSQLRSVTEEIASDLRLARQLALTNRDRVRIVIDTEQQELITRLVNANTTHHVYRYAGKGLIIEEPSAGWDIQFQPSGRSATPTTIQLQNREGQTKTLTVSITGRVSIL
jgi:type IV fimbrial biogenesis protein FimT